MDKPLEIQVNKEAMLSGPVLMLRPILALSLGGVAEALVYQQLYYRAGGFDGQKDSSIRLSYTRLQRQLPFFTRRWIIEIVGRLEAMGAIRVVRGKRVNVFAVRGDYDLKHEPTPQNTASMLIFPGLACTVGLMEAAILQQIHLRHFLYDGSVWVIRSLNQWHADMFMFLGIATVKRLFSRLVQQELVLVRPYRSEVAIVNSYRVNYVRVAEALEIPLPHIPTPPFDEWSNEWTNPLYPAKQSPQEPLPD